MALLSGGQAAVGVKSGKNRFRFRADRLRNDGNV